MAFSNGVSNASLPWSRPRLRWESAASIGLLLVALTLAIYAQVFRFDFCTSMDDGLYVIRNPMIRQGLSQSGLRWAFSKAHFANWIPLTWLSLMLDATVYKNWAGGFHLTNVLFHLVNVLLVFSLFARITANTWRSAFVAALFAIHPIHVESVAWISERKDVLSMLFGLLCLHAYVRYTERRRLLPFAMAHGFFILSLLAKQTLVTLPFLLLLLDYWPLGRLLHTPVGERGAKERSRESADQYDNPSGRPATFHRWREWGGLILEKLPLFAISAVFCWVALFAQENGKSVRTLAEVPLTARVLNAVLAYGLYIGKALFPSGLGNFYPHPGTQWNFLSCGISAGLLAAITAFAVTGIRRRPFKFVGWFWFLGSLVPMIGLIQIGMQQLADRYAYVSFLGLYMAGAWLVPDAWERSVLGRRLLAISAGGMIAIYAGIAFVQVGYWRDGLTVMQRALVAGGESAFVRCGIGDELMYEGRIEEALEQFRHAVRIDPHDALSHIRAGAVLESVRRFGEAEVESRAALAIDERSVTAHNLLGAILSYQERFVDARREFERALEIDPNDADSYFGLAVLCWMLGENIQSIAHAQRALAIDEEFSRCYLVIAADLRDLGRPAEAVAYLEQVLARDPTDAEARIQLQSLQGQTPHENIGRPQRSSPVSTSSRSSSSASISSPSIVTLFEMASISRRVVSSSPSKP